MILDRTVALGLIPLLLWPSALLGQQKPAVASEGLKIIVVRGEDSKNNIRLKTAEPLVVKVVDSADNPVPGAEVVFQVPASGPSGRFYDWLQTQTVKTDAEGLARAQGFAPNDEPGRWHVRVLATDGARSAQALVPQTNIAPNGSFTNGKSRRNLWITLGVIGAAAIAGGVAASRSGDSPSPAAAAARPVVIAPGPITVGGPR